MLLECVSLHVHVTYIHDRVSIIGRGLARRAGHVLNDVNQRDCYIAMTAVDHHYQPSERELMRSEEEEALLRELRKEKEKLWLEIQVAAAKL